MAKKNQGNNKGAVAWALARISIGLIFLWAFFDKLLGLGYATCRAKDTGVVTYLCDLPEKAHASSAWINGGSPTYGFLKFGSKGPLADFFQGLASTNANSLVNWMFMMGLLLIGIALTFGIAMKLATIAGSLLLLMMWMAALWPANNPILDDHIVYIFVLLGLKHNSDQQKLSLNNWWKSQSLVKKLPILG